MTHLRASLDLSSAGHSELVWEPIENLGGEETHDRVRGPLNKGDLFAERQGYHMPGSPIES